MSDAYSTFAATPTTPANDIALVTPSDTVDLAKFAKGLILGAGGIVKINTVKGTTVSPVLPAGYNLIRVSRVWSTGTAGGVLAAGIWALLD